MTPTITSPTALPTTPCHWRASPTSLSSPSTTLPSSPYTSLASTLPKLATSLSPTPPNCNAWTHPLQPFLISTNTPKHNPTILRRATTLTLPILPPPHTSTNQPCCCVCTLGPAFRHSLCWQCQQTTIPHSPFTVHRTQYGFHLILSALTHSLPPVFPHPHPAPTLHLFPSLLPLPPVPVFPLLTPHNHPPSFDSYSDINFDATPFVPVHCHPDNSLDRKPSTSGQLPSQNAVTPASHLLHQPSNITTTTPHKVQRTRSLS